MDRVCRKQVLAGAVTFDYFNDAQGRAGQTKPGGGLIIKLVRPGKGRSVDGFDPPKDIQKVQSRLRSGLATRGRWHLRQIDQGPDLPDHKYNLYLVRGVLLLPVCAQRGFEIVAQVV